MSAAPSMNARRYSTKLRSTMRSSVFIQRRPRAGQRRVQPRVHVDDHGVVVHSSLPRLQEGGVVQKDGPVLVRGPCHHCGGNEVTS
eukprot:7006217-Pyramimonas_sp.AAC.1